MNKPYDMVYILYKNPDNEEKYVYKFNPIKVRQRKKSQFKQFKKLFKTKAFKEDSSIRYPKYNVPKAINTKKVEQQCKDQQNVKFSYKFNVQDTKHPFVSGKCKKGCIKEMVYHDLS